MAKKNTIKGLKPVKPKGAKSAPKVAKMNPFAKGKAGC